MIVALPLGRATAQPIYPDLAAAEAAHARDRCCVLVELDDLAVGEAALVSQLTGRPSLLVVDAADDPDLDHPMSAPGDRGLRSLPNGVRSGRPRFRLVE